MERSPLVVLGLLTLLLPAACTSTQSTLDPAKVAASQPAPAAAASATAVPPAPAKTPPMPGQSASASTPAAATPAPPAASGQQAALTRPARIEFAPIVGATVDSVGPLSHRLALDAKARGIAIAPASDPGITHVLKGYFSAFSEGKETTVVYVWDVIDPSGNRLHRIQGQKVITGTKGDGWASVTPATMEAIADDTISQFASWLSGAKA
jgi:hypothetical protein